MTIDITDDNIRLCIEKYCVNKCYRGILKDSNMIVINIVQTKLKETQGNLIWDVGDKIIDAISNHKLK